MKEYRALTLHFAPDTCARVPLIALEEIGSAYTLEVVAFMKGEHRSPEYLALNRSGKVPTLIVDGEALTENVAILSWLAAEFPEAQLLPAVKGLGAYQQLADLAYCASGLHPIVTRLRIPHYFCDLPEARDTVFRMAETAMRLHFASIDRHHAEIATRPSVLRAFARNDELAASLAARGLAVTFSGAGAYAPPKR